MIRALLIGATLASPAQAANFWFCWTGANAYTMSGQMRVPDAALAQPMVTAEDVTLFRIAGYHRGQLLGEWDIDTRDPATHGC